MKADIEQVLKELFDGVVDVYNVVTNVSELPYAVFAVNSTPRSTKDGVYRFDHSVDITIVTGSYDSNKTISDEIERKLFTLKENDFGLTISPGGIESDSDTYVNRIECLIIELV
ncbi:hypothetical protein [Butyricimonas synergistica]|uniref:hypothetical protein n=1 Tax=Butyricimonas synergistica TaxID=544644 RepID=UPI0022E6243D|nr:hypothetical protein [Butyricimonas synergistica]